MTLVSTANTSGSPWTNDHVQDGQGEHYKTDESVSIMKLIEDFGEFARLLQGTNDTK